MNNGKKNNQRNVICAILCVLAAVGLCLLLYTNQQQEEAQTAVLETVQAEAEPYESELRELQEELSNLKNDISYTSEKAEIMVGFVLSDVSDLSYIEEKAETYSFIPVLILDCNMDTENMESIIAAADEDWEIMLYASVFSEDTNDEVLSAISYLESVGREHTGIFFLRSDYATETNAQLISDDGFIGYTSYHEEFPTAGQTDDGMVYFDYSYLTTSGTAITSRLYSLYGSKSSMIVTFDMASINSGRLSESYVISLLDTMQDYTEYDDCSFSTVASAVAELSEVNAIEAENQEAYEDQAAEIQARIDELQEIIDNIYDKAE